MKWFTMTLALLGFGGGIWIVATSSFNAPDVPSDRPPPTNPYVRAIAASGVVESAGRNIRVGSSEPGLVTQVFVTIGDSVEVGEPLFQLDDRHAVAEVARARAAVGLAAATLSRLKAMPRPEDIPPLRAVLDSASARRRGAQEEFDAAVILRKQRAMTATEFTERETTLAAAVAAEAEAQARLKLMSAGAWEWDVRVSEASLELSQADLAAADARLSRLTVCAPICGTILKRDVEPGEYTVVGGRTALTMGDISSLRVRAMVDERDIPLLEAEAAATALAVSDRLHRYPLRMLQIEPLAVPKTQLTGANAELVDTRVIEVLFEVEKPTEPAPRIYPGQIMDVFINVARKPASP